MCVGPDGAGRWRFALTAAFGSALSCRTQGRIARAGDAWRFTFAGVQDCSVLLHEEEDELRLPGKLPSQCDSLCPGRSEERRVGKSVSVRVDLGGRRIIKKKNINQQ